jgi:Mn-dependent DtxR family transcriptional regulator
MIAASSKEDWPKRQLSRRDRRWLAGAFEASAYGRESFDPEALAKELGMTASGAVDGLWGMKVARLVELDDQGLARLTDEGRELAQRLARDSSGPAGA